VDTGRRLRQQQTDTAAQQQKLLKLEPEHERGALIKTAILRCHAHDNPADFPPGIGGHLKNTHLGEKVRTVGEMGYQLTFQVPGAEIDAAAEAGTEKITREMEDLRRDQKKVPIMEIEHGIFNEKAAGAVLNIGKLVVWMVMVTAHHAACFAGFPVHVHPRDLTAHRSDLVFHVIPPASVEETVKLRNSRGISVLIARQKL
jgi:hypothetical protein